MDLGYEGADQHLRFIHLIVGCWLVIQNSYRHRYGWAEYAIPIMIIERRNHPLDENRIAPTTKKRQFLSIPFCERLKHNDLVGWIHT